MLAKFKFTYKKFKFQTFIKKYFNESLQDVLTLERINKQDIKVSVTNDKFSNKTVFFDFQSTTPLDPRVLDKMLPYLTTQYGNPHSKSHTYGWEAEKAVEQSRQVKYIIIY